jgi:hypothetical protein
MSAADLLSNPSAWISRAPAAAFRGTVEGYERSGRGCGVAATAAKLFAEAATRQAGMKARKPL